MSVDVEKERSQDRCLRNTVLQTPLSAEFFASDDKGELLLSMSFLIICAMCCQ